MQNNTNLAILPQVGKADLKHDVHPVDQEAGVQPVKVSHYLLTRIAIYIFSFLKPGTITSSVLSMLATCIGIGIITLPYLAATNGIVLSVILIVFGAFVSYFCAMLLVECAEKIGKSRYEDFAEHCWGIKMAKFAGLCNISTLLGGVISYIVFIKSLTPVFLETVFGKDNVPDAIGTDQWKGQIVWGTVFLLVWMIPLSLPRKIGSLEYASSLCTVSAIYLILCLIFLFFTDRSLVPDIGESIKKADYFVVSVTGLAGSVPFVIFSNMYQPSVPLLYNELKNKSKPRMRQVLIAGGVIASLLYSLDSIFGYLGVLSHQSLLDALLTKKNVLEVEYNSWAFNIAILALLFTVMTSVPIILLPAKDDFESVFFGKNTMTTKQNVIVTLGISVFCWLLAISVPQISDAISILGWTTLPMSGFIFPVMFFLKMYKNEPNKTWRLYLEIVLCWVVFFLIIGVSVASLALFILGKL